MCQVWSVDHIKDSELFAQLLSLSSGLNFGWVVSTVSLHPQNPRPESWHDTAAGDAFKTLQPPPPEPQHPLSSGKAGKLHCQDCPTQLHRQQSSWHESFYSTRRALRWHYITRHGVGIAAQASGQRQQPGLLLLFDGARESQQSPFAKQRY